jgi:hypothetical protein
MQRIKLADLPPTVQRLNGLCGVSASIQPTPAARHSESESELQKLCEHELTRRRIAFLHLSPRAREKAGWPDLTFAIAGRAVAVELKTSLGQLSPDQERLHTELRASGWDVRVIRNYETFRALVESVQIKS